MSLSLVLTNASVLIPSFLAISRFESSGLRPIRQLFNSHFEASPQFPQFKTFHNILDILLFEIWVVQWQYIFASHKQISKTFSETRLLQKFYETINSTFVKKLNNFSATNNLTKKNC